MLVALRRRQENANENSVRELERIITVHTIFPLRTRFLRQRKTKDRDKTETDHPNTELLASLSNAVSNELKSTETVEGLCTSLESITIFFDLSLKCSSLSTSKQRITEAPWLQEFFLQLARCTLLLLPPSVVPIPPETSVSVLKKMIGLINVCKIRFETSFLETIIRQYAFNYDRSSDHPVDWELVSLCMQNDENLMLPFSSEQKKTDNKLRPKSKLLEKLLSKLIVGGLKNIPRTPNLSVISESYNFTLDNIACPLAEAFIHARDLPGFIDTWLQQLTTWRTFSLTLDPTTLNLVRSRSIWEDEKLLRTVAASIETLTVGQISSILQTLLNIFQPQFSSPREQSPGYYARIVILDCVVDGIKREIFISQTSKTIQGFYAWLSEILTIDSNLPSPCRWRIWRILATIMNHWFNIGQVFRNGPLPTEILVQAQTTIQQALVSEETSQDVTHTFDEALYAMQFIITLMSTQYSTKEGETSQSRALQAVIETIVSSMERRISTALVDEMWDGSRQGLSNRNILLLACATELTLSPYLLRYVICFKEKNN